ncbi:MAG: dihydrofolate reductase family protein [Microbacterium sp.]
MTDERDPMRRLVYYVATTLDGFIASPDRTDPSAADFFAMTPDLLEHIVQHFPETLPAAARQALGVDGAAVVFDTVVEGRRSYQVGLDAGVADAYPHLRHVVFSRSMKTSPDPAVELVDSDPVEFVARLKEERGMDIWLVGGGALAAALLPQIDRLVLKQNPSVIGSGVPLFDGPFAPNLFRPVEEVSLAGGVRVVTYDRR